MLIWQKLCVIYSYHYPSFYGYCSLGFDILNPHPRKSLYWHWCHAHHKVLAISYQLIVLNALLDVKKISDHLLASSSSDHHLSHIISCVLITLYNLMLYKFTADMAFVYPNNKALSLRVSYNADFLCLMSIEVWIHHQVSMVITWSSCDAQPPSHDL